MAAQGVDRLGSLLYQKIPSSEYQPHWGCQGLRASFRFVLPEVA
jgi:hypothetical protein